MTACWPGAKVPAPVNSSIIQALAESPRYLAARLAEVSGVLGMTTMKSGDSNTSGGGGPVTTGAGGGAGGGDAAEAQPQATIATTASHSALRHIARDELLTSSLPGNPEAPPARRPRSHRPCLSRGCRPASAPRR